VSAPQWPDDGDEKREEEEEGMVVQTYMGRHGAAVVEASQIIHGQQRNAILSDLQFVAQNRGAYFHALGNMGQ
jgi:hypothetical protein